MRLSRRQHSVTPQNPTYPLVQLSVRKEKAAKPKSQKPKLPNFKNADSRVQEGLSQPATFDLALRVPLLRAIQTSLLRLKEEEQKKAAATPPINSNVHLETVDEWVSHFSSLLDSTEIVLLKHVFATKNENGINAAVRQIDQTLHSYSTGNTNALKGVSTPASNISLPAKRPRIDTRIYNLDLIDRWKKLSDGTVPALNGLIRSWLVIFGTGYALSWPKFFQEHYVLALAALNSVLVDALTIDYVAKTVAENMTKLKNTPLSTQKK